LAIVSHDLKNPLSAIYMNARLIQGAAQGAVRGKDVSVESIRRQALIIQQSAERMNRLIRDLLDQAKIETGHFALDRRKVDFAGIVHETLEMLSALAAQKEIALNSNEVPSGIEVPCDRERVAQVLSNLIGNAIKFTPIGGQIDVSAEHSASAIRVAIRDTGSGIDPLHVPHIFDRYWQPEHNATKGTGLGLAIAKGIVEAHGGKIWVESRPHFGSTFYFTLPLEVDALTA
jgi:signal transduction histidine kinase